ncbi:MAG: hypothetical protein DMG97_25030 [Acidobacteria bacterium]|nr:MAG: hypothetical protein DMG97_25030 [Acidobacteriota bacterium]
MDAGLIRTTMAEQLGKINAANLKRPMACWSVGGRVASWSSPDLNRRSTVEARQQGKGTFKT